MPVALAGPHVQSTGKCHSSPVAHRDFVDDLVMSGAHVCRACQVNDSTERGICILNSA